MNKIRIEEWNGHQIRFVWHDGEWWAVAKDVAKALGYRMASDMTRNLDQELKSAAYVQTRGGRQKLLIISPAGLKALPGKSRSPHAVSFADFVGAEVVVPAYEQITLSIIERAYRAYKAIRQYPVGKYRIDLYFPELNLAVECDEKHHRYRKNYDAERERTIKAALGCEFIRYNPDEDDFNIGDVIFKINEYISRKKEGDVYENRNLERA